MFPPFNISRVLNDEDAARFLNSGELLLRADRAIVESKKLLERLSEVLWTAKQLDRRLHDLHDRRIEEESRR